MTIKPSHEQVGTKGRRRNQDGALYSREGTEGTIPAPWEAITSKEIRLGRGQVSEPKRGEEYLVCGRQNGVTCAEGWQLLLCVFPNLKYSTVSEGGGQVFKPRIQRSAPEKRLGLGVKQPEGMRCGN